MEDTKIIEHAELDPFTINAKSSVKLVKNTKGLNWEIKVVSGEEDLIDELMKAAVKVHKELEKEFIEAPKETGGLKDE